MALTIPKYAGYSSGYKSTTGKPYATTMDEARGDKEAAYLNPATSRDQATSLFNTYGKKYNWQPIDERFAATATPAATPVTPQAAAAPTIPTAAIPAPITPANSSTLFPLTSAGKLPSKTTVNIPKFNYDPTKIQASVNNNIKIGNVDSYMAPLEQSPTYKFALEEGQRALDAKMSAQGLTGSGAEMEANRRMVADLLSRENDRVTENARANQQAQLSASGMKMDAIGQRYGQDVTKYGNDINAANLNANQISNNWQLAQVEADRLARLQQAESDRLTGQGTENWGRYMDVLGYLQNANTMGYASDANSQLAGLYAAAAPQMVQYLQAMKG